MREKSENSFAFYVSKAIKHSLSACKLRLSIQESVRGNNLGPHNAADVGERCSHSCCSEGRSGLHDALAAVEQEIYWVARQSRVAWTINLMWKGD